jgi:predicted regulator of Ras-like GTPase activity (Roadblock/LC7/MglB family)
MINDKIVPGSNELAWMLDDMLKAQGTRYAVLLSSDGLMLLYRGEIGRDDAERVCAGMASVQSLSGAMMEFAGPGASMWRQTMMEFDKGFMFLAAAGQGAHLMVSTTREIDMEDVVFRMQQLVQQLSRELASRPRIGTAVK